MKFYKTDAEVATTAGDYVRAALDRGHVAVVVATEEHGRLLRANLSAAGVDVDSAAETRGLVMLDAAEMLERLTSGGRLNSVAFDEVVGDLLRPSLAAGRDVSVFGEVVGLLWDTGNVSGAMELEQMWDELQDDLPVGLLHAYPLQIDGPFNGFIDEVCLMHSLVVSDAPTPNTAQATRWFPGVDESPSGARRFVTDMLTAWDCRPLIEGTRLVVDELATNSIKHADSDFTVSLSRVSDGVELAVGDCSSEPPVLCDPDLLATGGRGLHLVAASATQWGHRLSGAGKLVWAQVGAPHGDGPD